MSSKPTLDPRAARSREWLRAALLALMQEKDYAKITVSEITDRAGLSRPTFYLHYQSKDDILIENVMLSFEEIMDEFSANISRVDRPGALAMTRLFEKLRAKADLLRVLSEIGAEKHLRRHLYQGYMLYLGDLARRYAVEILPEVQQLSAHHLAGSTLGLIFAWLQGEIPLSPAQMGEYLSQVMIAYLRFAIRDRSLDAIFNQV